MARLGSALCRAGNVDPGLESGVSVAVSIMFSYWAVSILMQGKS